MLRSGLLKLHPLLDRDVTKIKGLPMSQNKQTPQMQDSICVLFEKATGPILSSICKLRHNPAIKIWTLTYLCRHKTFIGEGRVRLEGFSMLYAIY